MSARDVARIGYSALKAGRVVVVGDIVAKNPDEEIVRKMWLIAQALKAKVQGDDRELYDANGDVPESRAYDLPSWCGEPKDSS